jgi:hypothetical protein
LEPVQTHVNLSQPTDDPSWVCSLESEIEEDDFTAFFAPAGPSASTSTVTTQDPYPASPDQGISFNQGFSSNQLQTRNGPHEEPYSANAQAGEYFYEDDMADLDEWLKNGSVIIDSD